MKVIFDDWMYGMGKAWKKIIISVIAFSMFFLMVGNLLLYTTDEKNDPYIQNKKGKYIYCSLYRTAADSSDYRILERPFLIEGMKSNLLKLREDENFEYIAINEDSYAVIDTETLINHFGNDNYRDFIAGSPYRGYYDENPQEIENIELENGKEARRMLACKIDSNAVRHYKLEVAQGKLFEEQDYIFDTRDRKMSVLLGAQYKKYFEIGDKINIHLYGLDVETEIKGFLKDNTVIEHDNTFEHMGEEPVILDYSVIIPYFGIKGGTCGVDEEAFVNVEYANQLSGTLVFDGSTTREKVYNVLREINDYYLESGIFTVNSDITASGFYFFQGEYSENMKILITLIMVLLCICIFNLYLSMLNNIEYKSYVYSVQIMSGKSWGRVCVENIAEVLFIVIVSLSLVFTTNIHWFYQNVSFYIKFFFIAMSVIFVLGFLLIRQFKKMDIEQMMRRS